MRRRVGLLICVLGRFGAYQILRIGRPKRPLWFAGHFRNCPRQFIKQVQAVRLWRQNGFNGERCELVRYLLDRRLLILCWEILLGKGTGGHGRSPLRTGARDTEWSAPLSLCRQHVGMESGDVLVAALFWSVARRIRQLPFVSEHRLGVVRDHVPCRGGNQEFVSSRRRALSHASAALRALSVFGRGKGRLWVHREF